MRRRRRDSEAAIDMTPMLDIVFIMLIFFIVTTSFVKESGIEVNSPNAKTTESKTDANIMVGINENGEIWIDNRSVDVRAVKANIARLRADSPEGSVVVQADKNARTGLLVDVLDQIREAGVLDVSVATKAY